MTDSRAALDMDRLPWLADTRAPRRRIEWQPVLLWGTAIAILVAASAYWFGLQSAQTMAAQGAAAAADANSITVPLPLDNEPRSVEVAPTTAPVQLPALREVPESSPVDLAPPLQRMVREPDPKTTASAEPAAEPVASAEAADPADVGNAVVAAPPAPVIAPPKARTTPRSPWESVGADGQLVRIGTFANRTQAKRGWSRLMKVYPGMKRLPAVVVPLQSMRNNRTFYRLQLGTTSQAHSAVLCQRMRMVGLSCVVVGTPEKTAVAA